MDHGARRRHQSQVGTVPVEAGVIGEALRVAAEVQLIIGLVEAAIARDQFSLVVVLETRARDYVEHTIGAVAEFR